MRSLVWIAVAGALAAGACGDDSSSSSTAPKTTTVDDAAVESQIKSQLATSSVAVTSVKCPSDEKAEKGAAFKCSVTWDNGATGKVKVTQKTAAATYTYEPVSGSVQVPGSTVEEQLKQDLAKQGAPNAQVNCPDNIIVKLDTTVTCNVTGVSGKAAGDVTYTFSSAEGTVDSSSVATG